MSQPKMMSVPASASTGIAETLRCVVCWEPLSNAGPGSVYSGAARFAKEEMYRKICAVLLIKDPSGLSEPGSLYCPWNFDQEVFPFCKNCFKTFQHLLRLQKNLEQLQRKLSEEVDNVKMKARASESKMANLTYVDVRAVSFRQQFLINESFGGKVVTRPDTDFGNHPTEAFVPDIFIHHRESNADHNHHQLVSNPTSGNYELNYGTGLGLQLISHPHQTNILHFSPSKTLPYQQSYAHEGTLSLGADGLLDLTQIAEIPSVLNKDRFENEHTTGRRNDNDDFVVDDCDNNYEQPSESDSEGSDSNFDSRRNKKISRKKNPTKSSLKLKTSLATSKNKTQFIKGSDMPVESSDGRIFYKGIEIFKNSKGYVCGQCNYTKQVGFTQFNLRKMKYHINGVHLGTYQCDICNKILSSPSILGEHKRRLHVIGKAACTICGKPIRARKNCMNTHLWTHKNSEEKAAAHAAGDVPAEILFDEKRKVTKKHCEVCGKQFSRTSKMKLHLKTHLNNSMKRDIKCPHCEDLFSSKATLRYHVLRQHAKLAESTSVLKKFLCLICNKYFTSKVKLQEHNARRHRRNENKEFQCEKCNKRFAIKRFLQEHLKNHKPATLYKFQCDVCSIKVFTENALRKHRKKNHNVIQVPLEKMFADSLAKLITKEANNRRINIEDKDIRRKCRKDGSLREDFESFPMFNKTDDGKCTFQGFEVQKLKSNSYKCVTCGLTFSDKKSIHKDAVVEEGKNIKIHIKGAHLGEYTCPYCQLQCMSSLSLSKHKIHKHVLEDYQLCDVCGDSVKKKEFSCHAWHHKSAEDMANSINSGEPIPVNFKILNVSTLEGIFNCAKCPESFSGLSDLNEHRINVHPINKTKNTRRASKRQRISRVDQDSSDEDWDSNVSDYNPSGSSDANNTDSDGEDTIVQQDGASRVFKTMKVSKLTKKANTNSSQTLNKLKFKQQKNSPRSVPLKKANAKSCSKAVKEKSNKNGPFTSGNCYKASNGRTVQDLKLQPTAAVLLSSIPSILTSSQSIKYISDELVSCVSRTGKLQLVALHEADQHDDEYGNDLSMELEMDTISDYVIAVKQESQETHEQGVEESLDYDYDVPQGASSFSTDIMQK